MSTTYENDLNASYDTVRYILTHEAERLEYKADHWPDSDFPTQVTAHKDALRKLAARYREVILSLTPAMVLGESCVYALETTDPDADRYVLHSLFSSVEQRESYIQSNTTQIVNAVSEYCDATEVRLTTRRLDSPTEDVLEDEVRMVRRP